MSKYKPQKDQADILDKAYDLIQSVPYRVTARRCNVGHALKEKTRQKQN
jgi:hypothetical protein